MKKSFGGISIWIFIFLVLMFVYSFTGSILNSKIDVKYSDLIEAMRSEKVTSVYINGKNAVYTLSGTDERFTAQIPSEEILREDAGSVLSDGIANGTIKYEVKKQGVSPWVIITPIAVLLAILFVTVMMQQTGTRGVSFTKSRAKMISGDKKKTNFAQVAGAAEEKEELEEVVEFLKNPKKFISLGARIPKGILLVGPPGTGKTLLARAVAGEADVPFYSISGSDFVELYVGVGASRVRDLFEQAKKNRPCIIFIDEIDAVGRKRGAGMGGGHDEREQTLNQLLVEMDGFGVNEGIIIMAATNRPDILDPVLLRPGRFDRRVVVDLPDIKGRAEILKVHSADKPLAEEVDLNRIAKVTPGYTGADLENLMNEAAIFAARRDKKTIDNTDIEDANIKVMMGAEKKSRVISEAENKLTAYHEAGHAVITKLLDPKAKVHQISIIPRGRAGGYTMHTRDEDKYYSSKKEMLDEITVLLGGRVAEAVKLDDISTGASNDIEKATDMAKAMVTQYGMSELLGPVCYNSDEEVFFGRDYGHAKNYSEKVAAGIDDEIEKIINSRYDKAKELLINNTELLDKVAEALLEKETLTENEFENIILSVKH